MLTKKQLAAARNRAIVAAQTGLKNAAALHYSEGSDRWQGIQNHDIPPKFPTEADCSSFVTWCLWNALNPLGIKDVVNGSGWKAGYTGTLLKHGKKIDIHSAIPGDVIIYGAPGSTGAHTVIVVTAGPNPTVISNGSEAAPLHLPWNYRPDFLSCRRYISGRLNPHLH